jgi:tryptophanyl-tRNA synthetase
MKQVILTGIRANNDLHIGNYFGALLPLVEMAKTRSSDYQINLFVPDLHSFTTPIDHTKLHAQIMDNLRVFAAAGLPLGDDNIFIYRQSYIPAHSELTWILDCFTPFGQMNRMTQFKDKSARLGDHDVSVGIFNYPVLMAADILLYGATYVPVGDDQTQHLEFTRDLAERMNNKFGDLFTVPKPVKDQHQFFGKEQGLRIRDLQDPTKKMSKSGESDKGCIFLSDDPQVAAKKIMSATTDSVGRVNYDYETQPGISNLLEIYELLGGDKNEFLGTDQYGPLKNALAAKIESFLGDFQAKLTQVDNDKLMRKLESSEAKMTEIAGSTLLKVQKAVGLRG